MPLQAAGETPTLPEASALIALIRDDNLVIYKIVVVEK